MLPKSVASVMDDITSTPGLIMTLAQTSVTAHWVWIQLDQFTTVKYLMKSGVFQISSFIFKLE